MPLAVVGSNVVIEVNGKKVRGRQYPWGVAEGRLLRSAYKKEVHDIHFVDNLWKPRKITHQSVDSLKVYEGTWLGFFFQFVFNKKVWHYMPYVTARWSDNDGCERDD